VAPTGNTIAVPAGGDFQAALNLAQPGDVISLQAGATFVGPFTLPSKSGTGWIIVRTSAPDSSLPPLGTRIGPSYRSVMPKLVVSSGAVITTAAGAHHFRFIGIEITPAANTFLYNLVLFGQGSVLSDLSHDIIFDRCYLHGDPSKGTRRGIALNARNVAVIDSYLADFKEVGADSQAIAGWNGPGPFKIVNNYLEAAGENVMFGGADPAIPNLVPADIEIRRNHFFKPLSWKANDPSYAGTPWTIKNLFELKNARRVLVDGNIFEHSWLQAQTGWAMILKSSNSDNTAPWSVTEDVTITNNIIRHAANGINIAADNGVYPSDTTKRILIRNNLLDDIGGAVWGSSTGILLQVLSGSAGVADVTFEHNTAFQTGSVIMADGPTPNTDFIFRNNIVPHNTYGIFGSGVGVGNAALNTYFPGAIVEKNIFAGGNAVRYASLYPPDNFFLGSLDEVGFVDLVGGDYRLAAHSPYKHASTNSKHLGAHLGLLPTAMSHGSPFIETPTGGRK
jgi:hypothetical protein